MNNKLQQLLLIVIFLVFSMFAAAAQADDYHQSGSGWSLASDAADSNGDGEGGGTSQVQMNGTYGNSTGSARSDLLPWDGFSFCDFDPDSGIPSGVLLKYETRSSVARFANGDLLYTVLDPAADSTLCFNFVDSRTGTFEIFSLVVGGTGRFESATGELVSTGKSTAIQSGHSGIEFEINGEIIR